MGVAENIGTESVDPAVGLRRAGWSGRTVGADFAAVPLADGPVECRTPLRHRVRIHVDGPATLRFDADGGAFRGSCRPSGGYRPTDHPAGLPPA
ncbi:hypothetical protein ABIA38_001893 [Embleya sp. AB8]